MNWLNNVKVGTKLISAFLIVAALLVVVSVLGFVNMKNINDGMTAMYLDRTVPIQQLSNAEADIYKFRGDLYMAISMPEKRAAIENEMNTVFTAVDKSWKAYTSSDLLKSEKDEIAKFEPAWAKYKTEVPALVAALKANDATKAIDLIKDGSAIATARGAMDAALGNLIDINVKAAEALNTQGDQTFATATTTIAVAGVLGLILAVVIGVVLSRSITGPLNKGVNMMQELGRGHLGLRLKMARKDEIGVLAGVMDAFTDDLQNVVVGTMKKIADGDLSTNVTPKDAQDEIGPALKATTDSLRNMSAEAANLTKAAVEGRLATRADVTKYKGAYRDIVEGVNKTLDSVIGPLNVAADYVDKISKGNIPPRITDNYNGDFNAIKNNLNMAIDAVNNLVADAGMLAKAAVEGKLATRADASKHYGDFRKIVEGVNKTLDSVIGPLNVAADYVDKISKGNTPAKITDSYNGDFNAIKNNLNMCIDAINVLVEETGVVINAAKAGQLSTRANADRAEGVYRKLLRGVNDTLDSVIGPLNVSADYVDKISKGNIPPRITDNYNGDFNNIKNNLNMCIDNLNTLVGEMGHMSKEHDLGDIDVAIATDKLQGAYKTMGEGINKMVGGHIAVKKKAMACIAEFGKGNFEAPLEKFPGKKAFINDTIEQVRVNLKALIADTDMLVKAAVEGKLATRADATKHMGDFRKIVDGVNKTLDSVIGPLNVSAEYVDRISKGNIPPRITDNYNGDFNNIKNNLNMCIDNLNTLVGEMGHMSKEHDLGDIDVAIATDKLLGAYKTMGEGINKMVGGHIAVKKKAMACIAEFGKGNFEAPLEKFPGKKAFINDTIEQVRVNLKALIADTDMLVKAAVEGKLATRADATKHQGDFRKIVDGVNKTLDSVIGPLNVAADYVDKISKGNIPPKITDTYNGDFNVIKNNLNMAIDAVNFLVADAGLLAKAAVEGKLATRADATKHHGDYRKIVEGVNNTLDSVIGPLNVSADYVDKISKGNIPPRITDTYNGDFNVIKNNLNQAIDAVNLLVADAVMLAKAGAEGKLMTRADASKHQGDYRKIVDGVNQTLDAVVLPINEASAVLLKQADNDLTTKVEGNYQGDLARIKNALNESMQSSIAVVLQLKNTSQGLAQAAAQLGKASSEAGTATQQIASSSQQVAKGASDQSTALQESLKGMEQLSKAIDQISRGAQEQAKSIEKNVQLVNQVSAAVTQVTANAQSALSGANNAAESAVKGAQMAHNTVQGMDSIKKTMDTASAKVSDLGDRSKEIGKIVATIDDIADQTNLLALNAAIEAARAGEQGRGFAVVADEVRKLAERSSSATKEIADLINGIQKGVGDTITAMQAGSKEVANGYDLANSAGQALDDILSKAREVGKQVEQINGASTQLSTLSTEMVKLTDSISSIVEENTAATEQMAASSRQVSKSVEGVAGVAEQNSAATQQVSASAQEISAQVEEVVASTHSLNQMAEGFEKLVAKYKLNEKSLSRN